MLKRKMIYAFALLCIFAVNILYVDYQPFMLLIIMLIFPVVLLVLLKIQKYNCSIGISIPTEKIIKGEKIEIKIDGENRSFLPLSIAFVKLTCKYANYNDESNHVFRFSLPRNSKKEFIVSVEAAYCGSLYFTAEEISILDYIGLFKEKMKTPPGISVTVMPELFEASYHNRRTSENGGFQDCEYSQTKAGDDPSEVFALREYIEGDNLGRIHWKLTSKSETVIVKDFSLPLKRSEVVLVELLSDSSINGRNNLDHIYETVFALGNYILQEDISFMMAYYDKSLDILKTAVIYTFEQLKSEVNNMIQMKTYERPYAIESFYRSELKENSILHYIRSGKEEDLSEKTNTPAFDENHIVLAENTTTQEIVDSFCMLI